MRNRPRLSTRVDKVLQEHLNAFQSGSDDMSARGQAIVSLFGLLAAKVPAVEVEIPEHPDLEEVAEALSTLRNQPELKDRSAQEELVHGIDAIRDLAQEKSRTTH